MNPVFIAVTRGEYILVGSRPASMLADGHCAEHRIHIPELTWVEFTKFVIPAYAGIQVFIVLWRVCVVVNYSSL